ncbi:MAG: hypothetical protein K2Q19_11285, partial [Rhodocyclaceae bacterium]|nr:hypothetical protein [Rhodocyclaceae bacterium]
QQVVRRLCLHGRQCTGECQCQLAFAQSHKPPPLSCLRAILEQGLRKNQQISAVQLSEFTFKSVIYKATSTPGETS